MTQPPAIEKIKQTFLWDKITHSPEGKTLAKAEIQRIKKSLTLEFHKGKRQETKTSVRENQFNFSNTEKDQS